MDSDSFASDFCPYDNLPCDRCFCCFVESVKKHEILDPLCNTQEALQVLEVAESAFSKVGMNKQE